jgi:hypothetical protein
MVNFPSKENTRTSHRRKFDKRKRATTIEPLRGSNAPGDKATIQRILARSEPLRVHHGRRKTWVEEFLVQWGPEYCTFGDALEQYYLGFDIVSISSLENSTLSQDLLPFVATKRPTRAQRRSLRRSPLSTNCIVQVAPSPQVPLHIRSIAGGPQALDDFFTKEHLPLSTLLTPIETSSRPTLIRRSSSAQSEELRHLPPPPRGVAGAAGNPPPLRPVLPDANTTTFS